MTQERYQQIREAIATLRAEGQRLSENAVIALVGGSRTNSRKLIRHVMAEMGELATEESSQNTAAAAPVIAAPAPPVPAQAADPVAQAEAHLAQAEAALQEAKHTLLRANLHFGGLLGVRVELLNAVGQPVPILLGAFAADDPWHQSLREACERAQATYLRRREEVAHAYAALERARREAAARRAAQSQGERERWLREHDAAFRELEQAIEGYQRQIKATESLEKLRENRIARYELREALKCKEAMLAAVPAA